MPAQMEKIGQADVVVLNGLGLEEFMEDALRTAKRTITASTGVDTLPGEDGEDPHIWLDPANCILMCKNIAAGLAEFYPDKQPLIEQNLSAVTAEYEAAQTYGEETLKALSCRELVTFHDGFSYFARAFGLEVAAAMEIEEGSEPSAKEIESVIRLVETEAIPAVFCEENGERQTAETVARQTGAGLYALTMGMDGGEAGCTDAIYHNIDTIREKMAQAKASGCFAVAMDVDAAGLPFLKNMTPPAGSKSVAELAEIVKLAERPFIVKGVMTVKGALKAKEAGAAAIVVSNHGGRVLDQCPATAEVLPEIAAALKGTGVKILVDGGIRTGVDVFKALALGADGVLICRPFVTAVYGGGEEGVKCYIDKLAGELADTMQMCGAHSLAEITPDMVRV